MFLRSVYDDNLIKILKEIQINENKKIINECFTQSTFRSILEFDEKLAVVYLDKFVLKDTITWNWLLQKNDLSIWFIEKLLEGSLIKNKTEYFSCILEYQDLPLSFLIKNKELVEDYSNALNENRIISKKTRENFFNYLKLLN
jgi:hypothetical protein